MKPFDLIAAKQGKPVQTIDGRKARILAFDIAQQDQPYDLAVAVEYCGREYVYHYSPEGTPYLSGLTEEYHLVMTPEVKEYWKYVYRDFSGEICTSNLNYPTSEKSAEGLSGGGYLGTVMIYKEEI